MGTLASAIATLENVDPAYNNPGAISGTGDTGTSFGQGIGIYSSLEAGQTALNNQVAAIYNGTSAYYNTDMTLDQFGQTYGNSASYGSSLGSILGVPSTTPLSQIPSGVGTTSTASSNPLSQFGASISPSFSQMTGGLSMSSLFSQANLENLIFIVIGLLLLAAGVFTFKQSQTVIQTVGRAARSAATHSTEVLAS